MTKGEYTFFIRHRLAGGQLVSSQRRKFHPGIVAIAVQEALGQIMKDVYEKKPSQLNLYAKVYNDLSVTFDTVLRAYKLEMPSSVVQLPDDSGIRWVIDQNYPNEHLIPMTRDGAMNMTGLHTDRYDDVPFFYPLNDSLYLGGFKEVAEVITGSIVSGTYYWVDGDDVTYDSVKYSNGEIFVGTAETDYTGTGSVYSFEKIETVSVAMVTQFSKLDETDEINIPSGKNIEILEYVFNYFGMPLQDLSNDSKSNPT